MTTTRHLFDLVLVLLRRRVKLCLETLLRELQLVGGVGDSLGQLALSRFELGFEHGDSAGLVRHACHRRIELAR